MALRSLAGKMGASLMRWATRNSPPPPPAAASELDVSLKQMMAAVCVGAVGSLLFHSGIAFAEAWDAKLEAEAWDAKKLVAIQLMLDEDAKKLVAIQRMLDEADEADAK